MKEYKKGDVEIMEDIHGDFGVSKCGGKYYAWFGKEDLADLHSLLSDLLETNTVKEPACTDCPHDLTPTNTDEDLVTVTPPSNSEKEECCELGGNSDHYHGDDGKAYKYKEEVKEEKNEFLLKGLMTPPNLPLDGEIKITKKECHCGKDGHAIGSINCPVHGEPLKEPVWHCDKQKKTGWCPHSVRTELPTDGIEEPVKKPELGQLTTAIVSTYGRDKRDKLFTQQTKIWDIKEGIVIEGIKIDYLDETK